MTRNWKEDGKTGNSESGGIPCISKQIKQ